MFSALRKRWGNRQDDVKTPFPSGVAAIGQDMQTKFSKGVQYNMKIIIKGERNTGKSCLLARLQGKPFTEAYIPSQEIQAASINWKYRSGDDVVKVDVWDIVDKGQKKKPLQDKLKISNDVSEIDEEGLALDAAFIDIYKGTHGVVMLLDITKPWTWKYIERELPRIPNHLPVLIMANFRDMGEHRLVDNDTILAVIENLDRPVGSAEVNFVESSLKNGFGLSYLYHFLNMPFLILQRETLLRQLEANALEIEETREMLLRNEEKEMQNYEKFISSLENRKAKSSGTVTPSSETDESVSEVPTSPTMDNKDTNTLAASPVTSSLPPSNIRQSAVTKTQNVVNGRNYSAKVEISDTAHSLENDKSVSSPASSRDIHEFTPEADLDPSFLEGNEKRKKWWNRKDAKKASEPVTMALSEEESDDEGGNPLVMDYQDFESDEENPATANGKNEAKNEESNGIESDDETGVEIMGNEIESDDSGNENPLVTAPIDVGISDDEDNDDDDEEACSAGVNDLKISSATNAEKKNTEESVKRPAEVDKEASQQRIEDSSDDGDENEVRYEVAGDLDIDGETYDDWLDSDNEGSGPKGKENSRKEKGGGKKNKTSDLSSSLSEDVKSSNGGKEADSNTASFMISPDDLDLFMSEQMTKSSISKETDGTETKVPKKKKQRKSAEGETKKKKKSKSERTKEDGGAEKEESKKKNKLKDGKKKSKRTKEAVSEPNPYELL